METQRKTLLGVLANRFPGQTENIATEALLHIINSSKESKQAFIAFLKQTSCVIDDNLTFKTQAQSEDDNSIPDLIGTNQNGDRLVIVENKFWAGLTDNQPNTYINQLPDGGLLLFVAPSLRLPTVWAEIKRRTIENGHTLEQNKTIVADFMETKTEKVTLAVASWRCLLNFLITRLMTAGDLDTVSDINQLNGLCDEQDRNTFIPLKSVDLSPMIGKRYLQYCNLVSKAAQKLEQLEIVEIKKSQLTWGYSNGEYIYNMHKGNNRLKISCSVFCWSKYFETPIWLGVCKWIDPKKWDNVTNEQIESLKEFEFCNPKKIYIDDDHKWVFIPIFLTLGAEESDVIDSIIVQVKKVLDLLP